MRQRNCNAEVPSLDQVKAERKRLRYRRRYRRTLASTLTALLAAAAIGVLAATLWFPVLEIHGSSMSPTLRDGQIVVAVKSSRFSEGDVIAFYHGNKLLVKRCGAVHLVAGHDHRFGHKNAGNAQLLREKCAQLGLGCDIIPEVVHDGITVSSTYIRRLVSLGQVERAMEYLGHPHILTQTVRHGRRIGHTIGIPTVNLVPPPHVLVPGDGVYIARVCLMDGSSYAAVTNVGTRPTVNNGSDLTVESWMLDFDGDLYGQSIRVEFYKRLRDEIRFDSLDALKAEIRRNADDARAYFASKA